MEYYVIYNEFTDTQYIKQFESSIDARDWIINHLDLSLNWYYDRIQYLLEKGDVTRLDFYK